MSIYDEHVHTRRDLIKIIMGLVSSISIDTLITYFYDILQIF